jgi:hypothetical protein
MIFTLLVLVRVTEWESGESVSLLSRTPKARAPSQFLECESASCRFRPTVTIYLFNDTPFLNHTL